ncbi:MAG: tRNA (adenine(22)-N(1))-methyltransferase TrmK, partial [Lachnospiraceae bacterium]|nr:tRNA (adenine(22)-N(1))-methyltransferase TrmK [Lachnospiraceae bacterium]
MERIVDLQRNGMSIIEDRERFCFGMDAVLLSVYAEVRKGENVLDMGTGTGILPILLAAKTEAEHLTGLEIQTDSADLARRNVERNRLGERITVTEGDIRRATEIFGRSVFDVVVSNPPYMTGGHGLVNPSDAKAVARHEILCTFADVAE